MDLERSIYAEWAAKALEMLPQEKKEKLILEAVAQQLEGQHFRWEVEKVFEKYAMQYAEKIISQPEFQEKVKKSVEETVDLFLEEFLEQIKESLARAVKYAGEQLLK